MPVTINVVMRNSAFISDKFDTIQIIIPPPPKKSRTLITRKGSKKLKSMQQRKQLRWNI